MYSARMRTKQDKDRVFLTYKEVFGQNSTPYTGYPELHQSPNMLQIGHSFLTCPAGVANLPSEATHLKVLHHTMESLELLAKCIQMGWMTILVSAIYIYV